MSKATYYLQDCPTCGRRLQVRVVYLGKTVSCQHCGTEFVATDPKLNAPPPMESGIGLLKRAEELLAMIDSRNGSQEDHAPAEMPAWQPLPR